MQGAMMRWMASHGTALKTVVLQQVRLGGGGDRSLAVLVQSRFQSSTAGGAPAAGARLEESGFESTTISDILKSKGKSADGSWLWCTTDDSVYNAVQSVCLWLIFWLMCGSNYWLIGHLWFTCLLLPFLDDSAQCGCLGCRQARGREVYCWDYYRERYYNLRPFSFGALLNATSVDSRSAYSLAFSEVLKH